MKCWLCGGQTEHKSIVFRSGEDSVAYSCNACQFEFLDIENETSLRGGELDTSRLEGAGLEVPSIRADFENGTKQSQIYIERFFETSAKNERVLEIGCSIGYFLKLVDEQGAQPYGLEINESRAQFVRDELGYPCFTSLEAVEKEPLRFHKIFMFYSLEYIPEPIAYMKRLVELLEPGGELIAVTPNLHDVLKDDWDVPAYGNFFYEKCSISYFSAAAARVLGSKIKESSPVDVEVRTEQAYSVFNHVNWMLNKKPRTTGIVGGDSYPTEIIEALSSKETELGAKFQEMIQTIDSGYKELIEGLDKGNRVIFRMKRLQ